MNISCTNVFQNFILLESYHENCHAVFCWFFWRYRHVWVKHTLQDRLCPTKVPVSSKTQHTLVLNNGTPCTTYQPPQPYYDTTRSNTLGFTLGFVGAKYGWKSRHSGRHYWPCVPETPLTHSCPGCPKRSHLGCTPGLKNYPFPGKSQDFSATFEKGRTELIT